MTTLASLFIALGNLFLSALIFRDLFNWFVSPLGLPHLTYFHALGLDLLASFLILPLAIALSTEDPDERFRENTTFTFTTLLLWGIAALIRLSL